MVFHRVRERPDDLFPDEPDSARFEQLLEWSRDWFNVLPLDEAVARLSRGGLPARAAVITFDDGYADNLTVAAPLLRKWGLPATFFIATGFLNGGRMWNDTIIESVRGTRSDQIDASFVGLPVLRLQSVEDKRVALARLIPAIKHLDAASRGEAVERIAEKCDVALPASPMLTTGQVQALHAGGMQIGAHSVTHPILTRLSEAEAREEIAESRAVLEDLLRERVGLFAFPNGKRGDDYLPGHVAIVRELGFDAAVTTNWGAARRSSNVMELPRFTPWDRTRGRFGLRLVQNLLRGTEWSAPNSTEGRRSVLPSRLPVPTTADAGHDVGPRLRLDRERPRISVVVPCYNAGRWIGTALRSVYGQRWPSLQVIVVDDGSTDGSADVVAAEFPDVLLLRQANGGVAKARNAGIARANGEWIAFLDADDVWLPGKLEAQWQGLCREPDARVAYTAWAVWEGAHGEPPADLIDDLLGSAHDDPRWAGPRGWLYAQLLCDSHVWTSTVLIEKALLDEVGAFDPSLRIGEDLDLWLRASRRTPFVRVSRPLALYRMLPDSLTKGAPAENYQALVVERAIDRWGYTGPGGSEASPREVSRALAKTWRDYAHAHQSAGNRRRALAGALTAVRSDAANLMGWKTLVAVATGSAIRSIRADRTTRKELQE